MIAALDGGDVALIVLSAFWGLLVLFLCVVLINTFRVLESTKILIDVMREETVPLLREVKGSLERTNRELDRVDAVLEATGEIVGRVRRVSGLVEEAVSGPLVKLVSIGVGVRKATSRFGGKGGKKGPAGGGCSGSRSVWGPGPRARSWRRGSSGNRPRRSRRPTSLVRRGAA